jgi:hypothetical protein
MLVESIPGLLKRLQIRALLYRIQESDKAFKHWVVETSKKAGSKMHTQYLLFI